MRYSTINVLSTSTVVACGVFVAGSILRDIERDEKLDQMKHDIDYIARRTRDEDPDVPDWGE